VTEGQGSGQRPSQDGQTWLPQSKWQWAESPWKCDVANVRVKGLDE